MDTLELFPSMTSSGFPLSMGTSLAMESVFRPTEPVYDQERKIPNQVRLELYDSMWFNIATLYRNITSAISKEDLAGATPQKVAQVIMNEVDVLNQLFNSHAGPSVVPKYYYSHYKELKAISAPGFSLRPRTTESQKFLDNLYEGTLKILNDATDSIVVFKDAPKPDRYEKSLILTHHAYDLIHHDKFDVLELLESNTGVLKSRARWNTKYTAMAGEDLSFLPFNRKILLLFGDRVQIAPYPAKLRKSILEIGRKAEWNPMTTIDRVAMTIQLYSTDLFAKEVITKL